MRSIQRFTQHLLRVNHKRYLHPLFQLQKTLHEQSIHQPKEFWGPPSQLISWHQPWKQVYDKQFDLWFSGGTLNMCYNALDRHVMNGKGDQVALIHESPATGKSTTLTYQNLLFKVQILAGIFRQKGLNSHSKILIYMPAIPEAVVTMLACARIGAPHVVVFGGFAPKELAIRLQDSKANAIVTASFGIEPSRKIDYVALVKEALDQSTHLPDFVLTFQRDETMNSKISTLDWHQEFENYIKEFSLNENSIVKHPGLECTPVPSNHPLYVLHTSGSTGQPKGIVRETGGYAVALAWSMSHIFGIEENDTMFTASDVGWILGHSYIVYGPLIAGASTVLFEGKPVGQPDASVFFKTLVHHKVKTFFCAPTALRAIKREDPQGLNATKFGVASQLEVVFLAGERCDPDTLLWCKQVMKKLAGRHVEVLDNWWSTEMGWPTSATCFGLKKYLKDPNAVIFPLNKIGSCGMPVPGSHLDIFTRESMDASMDKSKSRQWTPAPRGTLGNVVLHQPLPPGAFRQLLNDPNHQKMKSSYYQNIPGMYDTCDAGFIDTDGFVSVMGRVDDVINVAGHRLSTGAMEQVVSSHSDVAECCVIGYKDELKGEVPLSFVVLKHMEHSKSEDVIKQELVQKVRHEIGAFACFSQVYIVPKLPKTRSGKILRKSLRNLVNKEPLMIPPTVEDVQVVYDIQKLF